jgi:hypothetical protein
VTIGSRRPGEVEILDGLKTGEFVVVDGVLRTRPGQAVTVIAVDTGNEPLARLLTQGTERRGPMILSDVSVKRPVFAAVISLLLIVFGLVSFGRLPLREYPDIDPPVVTIETLYPGASANVVETRITELIEERIAGVEGIQFIASTSEDGLSTVTVEFDTGRDVDGAANDIRDRVSAHPG